MQIDLFSFWDDPFMFPNSGSSEIPTTHVRLIPKQISDCIWKPDIVFSNAKTIELYREPTINSFYKLGIPSGKIINKNR